MSSPELDNWLEKAKLQLALLEDLVGKRNANTQEHKEMAATLQILGNILYEAFPVISRFMAKMERYRTERDLFLK